MAAGNLATPRPAAMTALLLLLAAPVVAEPALASPSDMAPGAVAREAPPSEPVDTVLSTVIGSVYDPARDEPVVGVRVYLVGTPHGVNTDEHGWFRIDAPVRGRHEVAVWHRELNALGVTPPRVAVVLEPEEVTEVALELPVAPRAAALVRECPDPARPGGVVAGAVLEPEGDVALPGVRVRLAWRDGDGEERSASVRSRSDGTYVACGLPIGERIHIRARFLEEFGDAGSSLTLGEDGLALRDLRLRPERVVAVSLSGVLQDRETGAPIPAALVRLPGLGRQAMTDGSGRFVLRDVVAGTHDLEVEHLAYGVRRERVEVTDEREQFLRLRVPMEAIQLEGIEVVARSAAEEYRRRSGANVHLFTRRDIEAREAVARNVAEVIQGRIPGLMITRTRIGRGPGRPILCIATMRRSNTPQAQRSGPPCVLVIVDGMRLEPTEGAIYLEHSLLPEEIESIEFIPPIRSGFRYGTGAANGVLEIWTRGQGPWVERRRP